MKITQGQMYYRYINDKLEYIRILDTYKSGKNKLSYISDGVKKKNLAMTFDEMLKEGFVKLNADGYLSISVVYLDKDNIEESKDIVITVYRKQDVNKALSEPFVAARQCMYDPFQSTQDKIYMGLSITQDSCPKNVPFKSMVVCSGILINKTIAVYNIDKKEDIFNILGNSFIKEINNQFKDIKKNNILSDKYYGFANTLNDFIIETEFMRDLRLAFNIHTTKEEIIEDAYSLPINTINQLEHELGHRIIDGTHVKYYKELDLRKIKKDYILIADKYENIFVTAYDKQEIFEFKNRHLQSQTDVVDVLDLLNK